MSIYYTASPSVISHTVFDGAKYVCVPWLDEGTIGHGSEMPQRREAVYHNLSLGRQIQQTRSIWNVISMRGEGVRNGKVSLNPGETCHQMHGEPVIGCMGNMPLDA